MLPHTVVPLIVVPQIVVPITVPPQTNVAPQTVPPLNVGKHLVPAHNWFPVVTNPAYVDVAPLIHALVPAEFVISKYVVAVAGPQLTAVSATKSHTIKFHEVCPVT